MGSIDEAYADAAQRPPVDVKGGELEDAEHHDDGQQGSGDLVQIGGQAPR